MGSMKTIIWEKKTFAIFRSCAMCITSLRILLGLEFLRNLWNQMCLAVSKWSNVTAPVTEVSESHPYWGHFPFSSPSHPKSEFQRRVICGNLRQCANITILNQEKIAQNWLPGASRVPGNILAPISRAWEPKSGRKGKSFLEHGSEVRFLPLSSLEQCASHLFGSC